jgi:hypothetical protein
MSTVATRQLLKGALRVLYLDFSVALLGEAALALSVCISQPVCGDCCAEHNRYHTGPTNRHFFFFQNLITSQHLDLENPKYHKFLNSLFLLLR